MRTPESRLWLVAATLALALQAPPAAAGSLLQSLPGLGLLKSLSLSTLGAANEALGSLVGALPRPAELAPAGSCLDCPEDPDAKRNVRQIIESRGFGAEEHDVVTADGYILTIQRIVNPLVEGGARKRLKPVIMQHGLMSSSVDWVINSPLVRPERPQAPGRPLNDSQAHPNSLGFYLANRGYDVFLANSRGNIYGQRHQHLSSWEPRFWNFTFDEQVAFDLPAVIAHVLQLTGQQKVGYVGHSQGTAMMFGLLAEQPDYADVVEPFVALAPVAYVSHCLSPAKYFAVYTPLAEHINMWFATSNAAVRYLAPLVCTPEMLRRRVCENIVFLSVGFDPDQFDDSRAAAYLAHMPSGTSVKNVAHWGQLVLSGRFAHFDHGWLANQAAYGQARAPDYRLERIRSRSIALFVADNDWLASPKDVARLRAALQVAPHALHNMSELVAKWNHLDFVYARQAGELINPLIEQVFRHFD